MTDTTPLSARYAPRWYVKKARYDGADRTVLSTTGATSPELQRAAIQGETSAVTTTFSKRGLVVSVGGSYGPLVTSVVKEADGLTQKVTYGDLARTETVFTYDQRRRVRTVQTYRGPPSCWKVGQLDDPPPECQGYQAGAFFFAKEPTTFPLLLEDTEFAYDSVDNPVELRDWRLPHEWPAGAKPVSKKAQYDDLSRLKRLDYIYPAGKDDWTSPFAHEDALALQGAAPAAKPTVDALPRQRFDERLLWQTYRYDWLGNSVASDDDAHGFYDRSLGTIKNGTPNAGPYQLQAASNETPGNLPREGKLTAKYDAAGYLTDLALNRTTLNGSCLPFGKPCHQRFRYDWDEVGRLSRARRWDLTTPGSANEPLPAQDVAVELRHSYDGGDMRVVKEATTCVKASALSPCSWATLHAVYLFDSLDLRRAYFTAATGEPDYEATSQTEGAYLVANGVRLARLHHEDTLPAVGGEGLHVLLELADHLGSGTMVLDKATGELAERMTYQGYGSVESDYRPGRWGAFREDYRFTGKEEDSEVGLVYFGFRYLNTALGRWASADPLTIHQLGVDLKARGGVPT
jgi:RHS repeat-associated protein